MLHFRMNMPFFLMAFYGTIMIAIVLLLRAALKNRLPKFVFPMLWGVVLLRLLVPFSLSSPLSLPVPEGLFGMTGFSLAQFEETAQLEQTTLFEDSVQLRPGMAGAGSHDTVTNTDARDNQKVTGAENIGQTVVEGAAYETGTSDSGVIFHNDDYSAMNFGWFFLPGTLRKTLPVLYLLGLGVVAGILGWQKYCYARRLRGSLLVEHNETVNAMLREMGIKHVLVFTNDEIASPLVSGLLNPRIYLPTGMDFCNMVLLRHILAHEAMHVKRRDNWLKCVMLAALLLHWYNPLVWIMAKCLASDLEAACDAAVLKKYDGDERKSYAYSLLAMAITGSRTALLYSAFSRTEVERRVKGILNYRKATVFALMGSVLLILGSTVVFATGGQAPFDAYLTRFCYSSNSSWGVRVNLARDIALGENAGKRAEDAVLAVLGTDTTGDPEILEAGIRESLAGVFGVERSAFEVALSLVRDDEELDREYEPWGLTRGEDGFWLYRGEQIRIYEDKMLGSYQSHEKGAADVSVQRDRLGNITGVTVWRPGDQEYDRRTRNDAENRSHAIGTGDDNRQMGDGDIVETGA